MIRLTQWLIASVLSIACAVFAGEVFLRVTWDPVVPRDVVPTGTTDVDPNAYQRVIYPVAGWRLSDTHERVGEWGLALPAVGSAETTLTVAITGGSVAFGMAQSNALRRALVRNGIANDANLDVLNFAIPAYKQPQQILTVVEQLLAGTRPDIVINLDGFNEGVLARVNASSGVSIVWPSAPMWFSRMASQDPHNIEFIKTAAKLIELREIRDSLRYRCMEAQCLYLQRFWTTVRADRVEQQIAGMENELEATVMTTTGTLNVPVPTAACENDCDESVVNLWFNASSMLAQLLDGQGIRYIHVLQPNPHLPDSKKLTEGERAMVAGMAKSQWPTIAARITPLQRVRGRDLTASGVEFIDATQVFAETIEDRYADGCCHLTSKGRRDLAEFIVAQVEWLTSDLYRG